MFLRFSNPDLSIVEVDVTNFEMNFIGETIVICKETHWI